GPVGLPMGSNGGDAPGVKAGKTVHGTPPGREREGRPPQFHARRKAACKVLRSKPLVPGRALPEEPNTIIRGEMEGGDCPAGRGRRDSPCGEGIQVSGVKPTLSNTAAASSVER